MTNKNLVKLGQVLDEVWAERRRQIVLGFDEENDRHNSLVDWMDHIDKYLYKSFTVGEDFRTNMIKTAALCVASVEAFDKGHLTDEESVV